MPQSPADRALLDLLDLLVERQYHFVTPTPVTHARFLARHKLSRAGDLRDIFGWSLPFDSTRLDAPLRALAQRADILVEDAAGWRSRVRVSSLHGQLFIHSAYPTLAQDSVFLGPDTYRFADFVLQELAGRSVAGQIVDIGTGAGVGGVIAGLAQPHATVILTDINPSALRLAELNALHAGVTPVIRCGDGLEAVEGEIELALANPPYIVDDEGRTYRDGGDMHGARLSLDWALKTARRLASGGRMLLYTGAAIVDGQDALHQALQAQLPSLGCSLSYREIDPDVFSEEMDRPAYAEVERIAAVGAAIVRDA